MRGWKLARTRSRRRRGVARWCAVKVERHPRIQAVSEEARVTPIELFFDLVFVFSLTQVTALMAHDLTVRGVVRGMLVLALLWWCWVGYAWLGSVVRADEGIGRVAMFGAMAAMFVLALSVPEAFEDLPGGLSGPVVLAIAYLAVRLLHLAIFWLLSERGPGLATATAPVHALGARQHRVAAGRLAARGQRADAHVGRGGGRRLRRHDPRRSRRVAAAVGGAFRRATRPDPDRGPRRVDRRDRPGRRRRCRSRGRSSSRRSSD